MSSTEAIAARLRALAQDHFEGRLSHSSYRRLRGPLLDSLVPHLPPLTAPAPQTRPPTDESMVTQPRANLRSTGTFRVGIGDTQRREALKMPEPPPAPAITPAPPPPPPTSKGAIAAAPTANKVAPASPPPPTTTSTTAEMRAMPAPSRRGLAGVWIGVAVVLVAGGAGAFWYLRPSQTTPPSSTTGAALESNTAYRLVSSFAQDGDWSDARLVSLNTDLRTVGEDVLAAAGDSAVYQRFVDDVRQRVKEQQALSAKPLGAENSPIAALAVTLGLDLHSPDSAVRIAPPAEHAPSEPPRERPSTPAAASVADAHSAGHATPTASAPRIESGSGAASATSPPTPRPAAVAPAPTASVNSAPAQRRPAATPAPASAPAEAGRTEAPAAAAVTGGEPCTAALAGTRRPRCQDALKTGGGLGPMLAVVPAGAFEMGNSAEADERPVHHVSIGAPFAMSTYEVSQAEYRTFCERTSRTMPAQPWDGEDYPVVKVSWNDAQEYVRWLSTATGEHYRLPTEAEWEYAARAGVTGLFPSGDTLSPTDAWFSTAKQRLDMPARRNQQFNRNKFQLFHMVGNVREWVQDAWVTHYDGAPTDGSARTADGDTRVVRGGAYVDSSTKLRLTIRENLSASTTDALTGIRLVRDVR